MKVNRSRGTPLRIALLCLLTQSLPCLAQDKGQWFISEALLASQSDRETVLRGLGTSPASNNDAGKPNGVDLTRAEPIPGAEAVMTPDLLLVSPASKEGTHAPLPLSAFIGQNLVLKLERSDIVFHGLQGVMISVINDTSRPLVLDGDSAKATIGAQSYACASLTALQKSIMPAHDKKAMANGVFTKFLPAAATVGLVPTIEDIHRIKQPIPSRYGPDESRRTGEASRFGKRILWPHQKTEGVVYFAASAALNGAAIEMPVHTLFDTPDSTSVSGSKK